MFVAFLHVNHAYKVLNLLAHSKQLLLALFTIIKEYEEQLDWQILVLVKME